MFRIITLISLVSLLLTSVSAEDRQYHIALIAPLSGPVAFLGEQVRKSSTLAIESLDSKTRAKIKFSVSDDQFDTKQTVAAYHQLESHGGIDAVMVVGSPAANALAPIVEKKNQILMAVAASDPEIVKNRSKSFIHWVIPSELAKPLADELLKRDFKKLALIAAEVSGTLADINSLESEIVKRGEGSRIVYKESFAREDVDFKSAINSMKGRKVDAIVAVLFPPAVSIFAKQVRQLQLKAELVGMETFEDDGEVKAAAGALEGAWFVTAAHPTHTFGERFRARWGEGPGIASGNGYDATMMLAEGVAQSKTNATEMIQYLQTIKDFQGACGTYSASGDNRFTLPAALKRVRAGAFPSFAESEK
jgi:branched-chain amino acid transport system substrate-binding protein